MTRAGGRRFVEVSGAGVDLPGDREGRVARFLSAPTHRLARDLVEDEEGEYAVLAASSLDWTQVRPPRPADRPDLAGGPQRRSAAPHLVAGDR